MLTDLSKVDGIEELINDVISDLERRLAARMCRIIRGFLEKGAFYDEVFL